MRLATRALIAALATLVLCTAVSAQTLRRPTDPRNQAPTVGTGGGPGGPTGLLPFMTATRCVEVSSLSALPTATTIVIPVTWISRRSRSALTSGSTITWSCSSNRRATAASRSITRRICRASICQTRSSSSGDAAVHWPAIILAAWRVNWVWTALTGFARCSVRLDHHATSGGSHSCSSRSLVALDRTSVSRGTRLLRRLSVAWALRPVVAVLLARPQISRDRFSWLAASCRVLCLQPESLPADAQLPFRLPCPIFSPLLRLTFLMLRSSIGSMVNRPLALMIGANIRFTGPNNPLGLNLIPFYRFYWDKADDAQASISCSVARVLVAHW